MATRAEKWTLGFCGLAVLGLAAFFVFDYREARAADEGAKVDCVSVDHWFEILGQNQPEFVSRFMDSSDEFRIYGKVYAVSPKSIALQIEPDSVRNLAKGFRAMVESGDEKAVEFSKKDPMTEKQFNAIMSADDSFFPDEMLQFDFKISPEDAKSLIGVRKGDLVTLEASAEKDENGKRFFRVLGKGIIDT